MKPVFIKNVHEQTYEFPFSIIKEKMDSLLNFYRSNTETICFIDGMAGTFKTDLVNYSKKHLNNDVLIFKFNCYEGTTLDDIFLSFFDDLKKYSKAHNLSFTKIDTNSLAQKVNTYLNQLKQPCIIIFDSFENILKKTNPVEKEEIISYIKQLNDFNKFKIILIGNNFERYFTDLQNFQNTIKFLNFDIEQVKQYIKSKSIFATENELEKFYEIINGNVLQLILTINIIETLKTTLNALHDEYKSKKIAYNEFLLQKLLTFIPENVKKSLYTLALFNLGITKTYLTENNIFTKEQINYMLEKSILKEECGNVYIKNYIKKFLLNNMLNVDKSKIHNFWINFFENQLPLPPNNRTLLISRNTMRSQLEYHKTFIQPKNHKEKEFADLSLMSYLNSNLTDWNYKNKANTTQNNSEKDKNQAQTNRQLEKYELTKNELSLLNAPINMQNKQANEAIENIHKIMQKQEAQNTQQKNKTLAVLFAEAEELEQQHDLDTAFTIYCSLLAMKSDKDFYEYEPLILSNLAQCSRKQNKTIDAIDFYNKLTDLYLIRQDLENYNETKIKIALIYKDIYKINHARVIFEHFTNKKSKASTSILFKSYIELAEIEESLSNTDKAVELYKNAFNLNTAELKIEKKYLAEAYYKYAIILDSYNQTQAAMNYYQKCINATEEKTIFVASALSNIAEIMYDSGNIIKTVEFFNRALFIDEKLDNNEGVYYITQKLSQIAEISAPELVKDLLLKSHKAALKTNDKIYIINSHIELGDYFTNNNNNEEALKEYLNAKYNFDKFIDNDKEKSSIESRINNIKNLLPENVYNNIVNNTKQEKFYE